MRYVVLVLVTVFGLVVSGVQAQGTDADEPQYRTVRDNVIYDLAWNPGGTRLAVASSEGLSIYDESNQLQSRPVDGRTIYNARWNHDGTILAVTGNDPRDLYMRSWVQLIDAKNGNLLKEIEVRKGDVRFSWSPHSNVLAVTNVNGLSLWDVDRGTIEQAQSISLESLPPMMKGEGYASYWAGSTFNVAWSPDGNRIALSTRDHGIILWNTYSGQIEKYLYSSFGVYAFDVLLWSPDSTRLLVSGHGMSSEIFDIGSGNRQSVRCCYGGSASWEPNGKQIAVSGYREADIFDPMTGMLVTSLPPARAESHTSAIAWSADGSKLAVGSDDGSFQIWDHAS